MSNNKQHPKYDECSQNSPEKDLNAKPYFCGSNTSSSSTETTTIENDLFISKDHCDIINEINVDCDRIVLKIEEEEQLNISKSKADSHSSEIINFSQKHIELEQRQSDSGIEESTQDESKSPLLTSSSSPINLVGIRLPETETTNYRNLSLTTNGNNLIPIPAPKPKSRLPPPKPAPRTSSLKKFTNQVNKLELNRCIDETKASDKSQILEFETDNFPKLLIESKVQEEEGSEKTSIKDLPTKGSISPTKSILTNDTKHLKKKSVSFDAEKETVKKFTEGGVIVDQKNPFKNGFISHIVRDRKQEDNKKLGFKLSKDKNIQEADFVSTEDVLKESKYVKTYVKNPDKYFVYDPTVLARLKFEELRELKKGSREKKISRNQSQVSKVKNKLSKPPNSRIPSFKKVSKANYPDLSDIKVKTGTDLEKSLFNAEEVTKNAKKFDERVKVLQITSDDDLEELDQPLTKSESSDEIISIYQIGSHASPNSNNEEPKSFTNTVNSKEFKEYLDKKGLVLTPQKQNNNNSYSTNINNNNHSNNNINNNNTNKSDNCNNSNNRSNSAKKVNNCKNNSVIRIERVEKIELAKPKSVIVTTVGKKPVKELEEMDYIKKTKKTSVFHRLLPNGIFSSKRKTSPKETVPTPQTLYPKDNRHRESSNIGQRVVLERQSFHGSSANSLNSSADFKKQIERSRKSYAGDEDRSSSISSALTNAEEFHSVDGTDFSNDFSLGYKDEKAKGPRNFLSKQHSQSGSRERMQPSDSRDSNLSRQKTQRATLLSGSLKPFPSKTQEKVVPRKQNFLQRRSLERQSMIQKRVTDPSEHFVRSSSMDRSEITKRSNKNSSSSLPKPSRSSLTLKCTPDNSKEHLDFVGPTITSTPIQGKTDFTRRILKPMSPITVNTALTAQDYNVGFEEWNKLKEIKEKTDQELFNKVILSNNQRMTLNKKKENLYEKLPIQQQKNDNDQDLNKLQFQKTQQSQINSPQQHAQPQLRRTMSSSNQPIYAQLISEENFSRGSQNRNTFSGIYQDRNPKIIEETSFNIPYEGNTTPIKILNSVTNVQPPSCQSVAEKMLVGNSTHQEQQTVPQIQSNINMTRTKELSNTLSKEDILQKVKEFCRKSMNKTPTKFSGSQQSIQLTKNDISPPSYSSLEYHQQNGVPMSQTPQRLQSLPQRNIQMSPPISTSPIYAHVIKRNSIQSNASDVYDSPTNQHRFSYYPIETDSVLQPRENYYPQQQISTSSPRPFSVASPHLLNYRNVPVKHLDMNKTEKHFQNNEFYPEMIMRNPYDYVQQNSSIQQRNKPNGRSTPLILDVGSDGGAQGSQVYWSPVQKINSPSLSLQSNSYATLSKTHPVPNQPQSSNIIFLQVKDQIYRPINSKLTTQSMAQSKQFQQQHLYGNDLFHSREEDWQNDKSGRNQSSDQAADDRRRSARREDPRRHTLGGDMLQYGNPGGPVNVAGIIQGQVQQQRAMDLEMGTRAQKNKKGQPVRGYAPINQGPLFDDDPGIMSEVETASTGFRRGNKQRSSLPVVRTPSKTLERPLGLVFLQYRSETKRALLPNEITSIDTVRALFVRSFPRQLTMAYLEGPNVKIYIHDASKDMFYELEDVRSHLREIRDRSVLRLFESNEVAAPQVLPGGPGVPQPLPQSAPGNWDQDQSYFSEPEFDSEYQHQHIHKSKGGKAPYYVGASQTLPRGIYSSRNKHSVDGYTSSPERGTRTSYEEPYYSQYGTRGAPITPLINEEQRCDGSMTEEEYALYGMKVGGRISSRNPNQPFDLTRPEDLHRIRVEHMERQLANLTGLVQKALVNQNPQIMPNNAGLNPNYLGIPGQCRGLDDMDGHSSGSSTSIQANGTNDDVYIREKPPKLGKSLSHKSVSFEKSVSFSDDIQGVPRSHSPQHAADSKPPKPAIKSSTLPRTSSQERDRLKPPPPPKPLALAQNQSNYRPDITLAPEVYNHLRGLQKKAKDLRLEVRTLRRLSQAQAVAVREDIKDAFMRIRATLLAGGGNYWAQGDQEKTRISREEELYKQEVIRLENDLSNLESSVEGLRGEVINRRTRVNMAAVEDMALVLSRASKTVAELKMKFPSLQNGLRNILSNEMEKVVREEKFLKDEPDRLESALRRCKKLTGTLVTLKRLASVQEQRVPVNEPMVEDPPRSAEISGNKPIPSPRMGSLAISGGNCPPENALDALLDELQTFAKPQNMNDIDGRPDDSTSDDNSSHTQTLQNTVTTQLSQSSLYVDPATNIIIQPTQSDIRLIHPQLQHQHSISGNVIPINNGLLTTANNMNILRRLHSYPSGSDTDTSPPQPLRPVGKPPVPERSTELLQKAGKRIPPPPPPRTSSRSPLASPTSPNVPHRMPSVSEVERNGSGIGGNNNITQDGGDSSGNESGNDHVQRQLALEMRHQELLKKQKILQEQYARLQQMSKNPTASLASQSNEILHLKKTGSESNLPQKMGLNMTITGSMKNLNDINKVVSEKNEKNLKKVAEIDSDKSEKKDHKNVSGTTTKQVYETEIL